MFPRVEIIAAAAQPRDGCQSLAVDPRTQIGMALSLLLKQIHWLLGN
jgi:hypothetical protein